MSKWSSQFANDPERDFELYLELVEENEPQGKIERGEDGELYFSLFACPHVRVPFGWVLGLAERAATLPASETGGRNPKGEAWESEASMTTSSDELIDVLGTFTGQDFAPAVALARRLAAMEGASISKNAGAIPTSSLRDTYRARALNPRLPTARAQDCERLAQIAAAFPLERWHLFVVNHGLYTLSVFANEEGVGRFCLDLTDSQSQ